MRLQHVVLFGFAGATGEDKIADVVRRFAELEAPVPGIQHFESGENCSPEGLAQGILMPSL